MLNLLLIFLAILCAYQAIRAPRLIRSALWLAGVSALCAILLYRMGAYQVAVIELSVGAGLVTILFVFAIAIAGEDAMGARPVVPRSLSLLLVLLVVAALGWMVLPAGESAPAVAEMDFATVLWEQRGLDTLVQVGLIFAGVLGVLGLLAPAEVPEAVTETERATGQGPALGGGHPLPATANPADGWPIDKESS